MHQIITLSFVLLILAACSREEGQASIRSWCIDNTEICNPNAVK